MVRQQKQTAGTQLHRIVWALPYVVPGFLATFLALSVGLLLFEAFHSILILSLVLPASLFVAWLTWRAVPYKEPPKLAKAIDYAVLGGVIVWMLINGLFTAQHIFTNRDPGAYTQTALWLKDNPSIIIDSQTDYRLDGFRDDSGGFAFNQENDTEIMAHGQHALGALVGSVARVVGGELALRVNVVIGGLALLVFYGFTRLIVGHRFAALGTVALAVSLPMMYFSRDMYSESLALLLLFGGLSWFNFAMSGRDNSRLLWILTGLIVGSSALVRIDAYLGIAGLLVVSILLILQVSSEAQARQRIVNALLFMATVSLVCLIGWLDLRLLSVPYYVGHDNLLLAEIIACLVLVAVGGVLVALRNSTFISKAGHLLRMYGPMIAVVTIVLVSIGLLSRPLWYESQGDYNGLIAGLQDREGLVVDGTSRYFEHTMNWLEWYGGWAMVTLGLLGFAVASYRMIKNQDYKYLPLLAVFAGAFVVYMIRPSITPDHIWAIRRFLPIIIPGLIIFSLIAMEFIQKYIQRRGYEPLSYMVLGVLATLIIVQPYYTSRPFLTLRTSATAVGKIEGLCDALPSNAVVAWVGTGRTQAIQATRVFCDVTAIGYGALYNKKAIPPASLERVGKIAESDGKQLYVAVYGSEVDLVTENYPKAKFSQVSIGEDSDIVKTLTTKPRERETSANSIVVGKYANSTIEPIMQNSNEDDRR